MAPSRHELHRMARTWALNHRGLEARDGDDRLYDGQGRSYKAKARTFTGRATSFDFRYPVESFHFLIGVLMGPDGTVRRAFRVDRATFDLRARPNEDSRRFRVPKDLNSLRGVEWLT